MANKIITISRAFGSGGRTIGKLVAKELGIPCYDNTILEKIAEESGFTKEYVKEQSEYAAHPAWFMNTLLNRNGHGMSNQDYLWIIQQRMIQDLAEKGPCVIVGRCADYILRDRHDLLKVFIHADYEFRSNRIVNVYGETEIPTDKRLSDKDKKRRAYYQYYTDTEWGKAENYHIALDSGKIGIEKCAKIIESLY